MVCLYLPFTTTYACGTSWIPRGPQFENCFCRGKFFFLFKPYFVPICNCNPLSFWKPNGLTFLPQVLQTLRVSVSLVTVCNEGKGSGKWNRTTV